MKLALNPSSTNFSCTKLVISDIIYKLFVQKPLNIGLNRYIIVRWGKILIDVVENMYLYSINKRMMQYNTHLTLMFIFYDNMVIIWQLCTH